LAGWKGYLVKLSRNENSKTGDEQDLLKPTHFVDISLYCNPISYHYLAQGGFGRDYDIEEQATDVQTTYISWTAGRLYARSLEGALGYVEARRAGFRMVSRGWHKFLNFSDATIKKKRIL
jgi:hypothetical protein